MKNYDVIVIGAGAGGLTVAAGAASFGARVALVEKNHELGGDCLHYGCVPSKALITAAKEAHIAAVTSKTCGFPLTAPFQISDVMARVKAAILHIQEHDSKERFEKLGVDLYEGKGSFQDRHRVLINGNSVIKGKRIVIATGSRPHLPPIEGLSNVPYLTNETLFNIEKTPGRLLVIGGGPIGLEMAQSFSRFGTKVTVVEAGSSIFPREDNDIIPIIKEELEKELTLHVNTTVKKVTLQGDLKLVTLIRDGEMEQVTFDEILVSAGRKPNIEALGLDKIGVKVEKGVIAVNDYLQTSQPHIFAIGDVNGQFPFTHAAGMEGKVAIRNAVFGIKGKVNYDDVPWVTYTDPEVFHLGLTEEEAREEFGKEIRVFTVNTKDVDRFIADRDHVGLVKVITSKQGKILGAHAVGKNASDWMQEIVFAKANGHKLGSISKVIHPYPTHAAILQQIADLYWREKLFSGKLASITKKYIRLFR